MEKERAPDGSLPVSEQKYRSLVEYSPLWILETDTQGNIFYLNKHGLAESGYAMEDLAGHSILEFIPEEDRAEAVQALMRGLSGSHNAVHTRFVMKDGAVRVFLNNSGVIEGEDGGTRMIVFAIDVTAMAEAEQALAEQAKIESTVSSISNFLARSDDLHASFPEVLSMLGRAVDGSRSYLYLAREKLRSIEKVYEWSAPGQPPGRPLHERLGADEFPQWKEALLRGEPVVVENISTALESGTPERKDMDKHGVRAILLVPMYFRGQPFGILGIDDTRGPRAWKQTDIRLLKLASEVIASFLVRMQSEAAEREAREAAEEADRAKTVFLANMSHEIRTPLTGMIGMVDLAAGTDASPEQKEYLTLAKASAESLFDLLGGILDLAKIESGTFSLEPEPFSIRSVVEETLGSFSLRAYDEGIALAIHVDPRIPGPLLGDGGRIRQILENLTDNALKYTDEGEVVVRVDGERREPDAVTLTFSVKDTGSGIPEEVHEAVFDPFSRAAVGTVRRHGGSGLGLAISKQLVEMMGGHIELESHPGVGSSFRFTLRLPLVPGAREQRPEMDMAGKRALVADGHRASREFLKELLEYWGVETVCADDGEQALSRCEDAMREGRLFDLVLLDAGLGGGDGLETARRMKRIGIEARTLVIMAPGAGRKRDSTRWITRGEWLRIMKPVRPSLLERVALRVFGLAQGPPDPPDPPRLPDSSRPLRILVAEDNPVNRKLVETLLLRRGWKVESAPDGKAALGALRNRDFDAVLMDIQMPLIDGIEVTRIIREEERDRDRHVPIIALTAHAMKEDREACLEAGMDDYIAKPLREEDLIRKIEKLARADTGTGGEEKDAPPINVEDIRNRLGIDLDLVLEMLDILLEDAPSHTGRMADALEREDAGALTSAAHRLKGAAGNLGAQPLFHAARNLEAAARRGDLASARGLYEKLKRELDRVEAFLKENRK